MADIVFGIFILGLLILGYLHGFIKEFFKLVAVILGLYLSVIYHSVIIVPIEKALNVSYMFASLISFIVMFIIIYTLISLISFLSQSASRKMKLTGIDRILGALFGLFKAIFLVAILSIVLRSLPVLNRISNELMQKSTIYKTICISTQNLKLQKDITRSIK
ncbi:CvpA family protein [Desulfurella amilsii]|uniref:CvpA family protein n=1 Tax=Desulfurella amilsii TaxID=1562698 RepID=A0A1X4XX30_9BACT|nr:CvpA family protein [Desulfurella amilsii]OSS42092.1 CvpA family protein [Desulfurella amilsii]